MSTQDRHGLALSASSPDTARAFNHTVSGYLTCRADAPARLKELLAADPDYGLAHVLSGYFPMLGFNAATVPAARAAAETAQRLTMGATAHERAPIAALSRWVEGDLDATLAGYAGALSMVH